MTGRASIETVAETERQPTAPDRQAAPARVVLSFGGAHLGTLEALSAAGHPLVDFPSNPSLSAVEARSCVELKADQVGSSVVLMFENGDLEKPLLMGCVRSGSAATPAPRAAPAAEAEAVSALEGDVVRISGAQSLTLRCGRASVTLTSDGQVLVNGHYIETRASGTNRIQGGSVRIN